MKIVPSPCFRRIPLLLLAISTILLPGCVERSLLIRTEPAGARVFLNGQDKGITPAKIPFDFYGTWDLQIRMEENELRGSRSLKPIREKVRLDRPWHQMFPFDLFTEILYPGTLQVEHVLEYTFEPQHLDALRDAFDEAARQEGVQPPLEDKSATGSGDRR